MPKANGKFTTNGYLTAEQNVNAGKVGTKFAQKTDQLSWFTPHSNQAKVICHVCHLDDALHIAMLRSSKLLNKYGAILVF